MFTASLMLEQYKSPQLTQELVEKLTKADKEAFAMAYTLTFSYSTRVVYKVLGFRPEPSVVEELLQSAYLNAWRAIKSYNPGKASFSTWLSTIVKNCVFDHLAKEKSHAGVLIEVEDFDALANEMPAQDVDLSDRATLERLIKVLPQNQQVVLKHHYFEGLSAFEISELTGYPVGSVKVWLSRALVKMREAMS